MRSKVLTVLGALMIVVVSGAATHFGEKFVDLFWPAPAPELTLGKEVSIKAPQGFEVHMARTVTGTAVEFESLAPPRW